MAGRILVVPYSKTLNDNRYLDSPATPGPAISSTTSRPS